MKVKAHDIADGMGKAEYDAGDQGGCMLGSRTRKSVVQSDLPRCGRLVQIGGQASDLPIRD